MKLIGRTPTGGVIVDAELIEYLALIEAGRSLAILPVVEFAAQAAAAVPHVARPSPVEREALSVERKQKAVRRTAATTKKEKEQRICLVCEKPMDKSYSPLAKTHRGKCKTLYVREYARKHFQDKHGGKNSSKRVSRISPVDPAPMVRTGPNPSDPGLTDEERAEAVRAKRLALIKESAERMS